MEFYWEESPDSSFEMSGEDPEKTEDGYWNQVDREYDRYIDNKMKKPNEGLWESLQRGNHKS